MKNNSRTVNTTKNMIVGVGVQFLQILLNFVARTVFIYILTKQYLGINGLFNNIISVLNISELGISSAITFALYKPVADDNKELVKSLMSFYKRAYLIVGAIVLFVGLALVPFLDVFVKENVEFVNLRIAYLILLFETVSSYWFLSYKGTLLVAAQKMYVYKTIQGLFMILSTIIRIAILFILKSNSVMAFYGYSAVGFFTNILNNYVRSKYIDKQFPYLKEKNITPLNSKEKKDIYKNVFALSINKLSGTLNSSADTIIISSFIGVTMVGLYSNYTMIILSISAFLSIIFDSAIASLGNFYVTNDNSCNEKMLYRLDFIYFWLYGFCSICFIMLLSPFIGDIWLNEEFVFAESIVIALSARFLSDGLLGAVTRFRDVTGQYWITRYISIASVVLNIGLSLFSVIVLKKGISGIVWSTVISRFLVNYIFEPTLLYRAVFNKRPLKFYMKLVRNIIMIIIPASLLLLLDYKFLGKGIIFFVIRALLCIVVPNVFWLICYYKTEEFKYFKDMIMNLLHRKKG